MKTSVALQLLGPSLAPRRADRLLKLPYSHLHCAPYAGWLWYLNLKWFALFQQSHYAMEAALGDGTQILIVGLPLLIFAGLGAAFRRTLLLATSTNLTLAYAVLAALDVDLAMPAFIRSFAFNLSSDNGKAN